MKMRYLKAVAAGFLGVAAITAVASTSFMSVEVNAATDNGQYELMSLLTDKKPSTSNTTLSNEEHGIFTLNGKFRYQAAGTTNGAGSIEGYTNELQLRDSAETGAAVYINLDITGTQTAKLDLIVTSVGNKNININGEQTSLDTSVKTLNNISLHAGKNTIFGSGQVAILALKVTVSGEASSVEQRTITYHIGETTNTVKVDDNTSVSRPTEKPTSSIGNIFDNWYTSDDTIYDFSSAVTTDIDLYAKFIKDSNYNVTNSNNLTNELITAIYNEGFTSFSKVESLPDLNFSILKSCTIKSVSVGNSNNEYAINTGGSFSSQNSARGLKIVAKSAGKVTIIANGNGSARTLNIYKDSNVIAEQATDIAKTEKTEVNFNIDEAGTYYIGCSGTFNIFSAEFTPVQAADCTPTLDAQYDNDDAPTALRLIGTIDSSNKNEIKSVKLTMTLDGVEANYTFPTVYTEITGLSGYEANANKYYAVLVLNGITGIRGKAFTAEYTVTFNDGSTKTSDLKSFTMGLQE